MVQMLASLVVATALSSAVSLELTCLDGDGDAKDYWYAFKYPDGWDYTYMTKGTDLKKNSDTLDKSTSPVSRTLAQLYKSHTKLSYAFWNDEHPDKKEVGSPYAHAKGVVAFDGTSGFWLTHSLPAFPGAIKQGDPAYGQASDRYGQSYLCITINAKTLKDISGLAVVNRYSIYDSADNADVGKEFVSWALNGDHVDKTTQITSIKSSGGQVFTAFAKSAAWDDELYENLVAKHFKASLYAETWQNGVGKTPSWCAGSEYTYTVKNVREVNLVGEEFKGTKDHSKWAVSESGNHFCVGDINRQNGQAHRGGGTVCIDDESFAKQMYATIKSSEDCKSDILLAPVVV